MMAKLPVYEYMVN
jgi:hypothetical protein